MKRSSPVRPSRRFRDRSYVMGILNVTPDSFSDGGMFRRKARAVKRAFDMISEGADIIDVGGESTRPGARGVSLDEELDRVIPVISYIKKREEVIVSVDTRKSIVADEAIKAGASIVNDVSGLRFDGNMAGVIAKNNSSVIIMHMRGTPENMAKLAGYDDVIEEVISELEFSIKIASSAGIKKDRILIDPGIGFAKTTKDNLKILNNLGEFLSLGYPLCVGVSRKSFIGDILGHDRTCDRIAGSIAASVVSIVKGASIVRVHDVKSTVDAARIADRIIKAGPN